MGEPGNLLCNSDPRPQSLTVSKTAVTPTTQTIEWEPPAGGVAVSEYEVQYGESSSQLSSSATVPGGTLSYQAQNLQPNLWYYFRVGVSGVFTDIVQGATACELFLKTHMHTHTHSLSLFLSLSLSLSLDSSPFSYP